MRSQGKNSLARQSPLPTAAYNNAIRCAISNLSDTAAVNHLPSVELLESTHKFPGPYTFKVIGRVEDGFVARAVAAVRDQLEGEIDPPFHVRGATGGRHIAITVEPQVQNAWEVIAVYQRLSMLTGLEYLF